MQPIKQGSLKVMALGPLEIVISQIYPDVLQMAKTLKLPQACIIDQINNSDINIISSTFSELMKDVADLRSKLNKKGDSYFFGRFYIAVQTPSNKYPKPILFEL
ncbi:MAG: hypothetical protein EHM20_05060 [Alphaproteobacteria bacterium]|nr:MAG: hypothetical protein EHM20_05060 [Alphaproteobacteria bacterium]